MRRKEKGSITVFLSLVMVLVVSIVGASIDLARLTVAKTHSYRTVNTALDATFTNYCEELFEEYHLYLLMNNKEMEQLSGEEFIETMSEFMYATFSQEDTVDLMEVELDEGQVIDTVSILEYDGELFAHQVEEYMKYEVVADGMSTLLEKMGLLQESKEVVEVLRKKMKLEEQVSKIDKKILDLMEEVEGLKVTYKGLKLTSDGNIAIESSFAKKLMPTTATPENLSIRHNVVWNSVKGHHINLVEKLQQVESWYEQLKQEEETEEGEQQKKDEKYEEKIINQIKELSKEAKNVKQHVEQAEKIIEDIEKLQEKSKQQLATFSTYLSSKKGSIGEEIYEGIVEEYEELETYVTDIDENGIDVSIVGDIVRMKETLEKNKEILTQTISLAEHNGIQNKTISSQFIEEVSKLKQTYRTSYKVKTLAFNYDTLSLDQKSKSVFSVFSDLISGGILGLVMDDVDQLSKATRSGESTYTNLSEIIEKTQEENVNDLADQLSDQKASSLSDNMEYYEASFEEQSWLEEQGDTMIRKFLLTEYGSKNFKQYLTPLEEDNELLEKETVLEYEVEYLISGKSTDYDNVKTNIMKTLFFRTISNYIALVMDSKCRAQAQQGAVVAVGFTGLVPLISVTKHLILMTWAFEESLVDVRSLLEGKEVPLYKAYREFSIGYADLLLVSKQMIAEKAKKVPETSKNSMAFTYEDYLKCYLLLVKKETLCYRMMDLIEGNMKLRYNNQFSLREGIFGITVQMTCSVGAKFLSLPGIRSISGYDGDRAQIEITTSYSY